ncbi:MAG: hypothetical protein F7B20_05095 [Aeropyrum sp.]|nr:hypothetical protein [Aeropyrum sp.]MCE4616121.1 hypothetical protein [Aeropyrum sp.]
MPRAVLRWMACDYCGRSPAPHECKYAGRAVRLCTNCAIIVGARLGCVESQRPRRMVADVDQDLIESLKPARKGRRRARKS